MQFSYSWLKTWVNPGLSADELAHLLTMSGLEVEEQNSAAPDFSGVVVAEVLSVEKHPDADRLNITKVNVGTGEDLQIVCGAPNVRAGIKVPCALSGALLPGNFKIKPTKMRGQVSDGMLCSARELGISEEASGLLILPSDAPVGANIRDYLDLDDTVFTLKITPNRADCLSIRGLAREVKALTHAQSTPLGVPKVPAQSERYFPVHIESPDDCGRLLTRVIEGVDAKTVTPDWMKQRLERSGVRSVSILVDIGNYVMLELGQPMHVFDLDKLSGSLKARRAIEGESLVCLNGKTVTLSDNTLVIADDKQALSIAGLMGGAATAVSDETQNILLESAYFVPEIIAGRSRQYGFGSDSSFRFERGVDYQLQETALERASALIIGLCGGRCAPINEASGKLPFKREISVNLDNVRKLLGFCPSAEQSEQILHDLGLQPQRSGNGFIITAPSFRFDMEIEADVVEEIARVYGYDKIPDRAPTGSLRQIRLPETQSPLFDVFRKIAQCGYHEVINYAFVDEAWEHDFADNSNPIRLQNPIASQMSVMRSTLIGGLVATLQNNLNRKQNRVRVFEIARVFQRDSGQAFRQTQKIGLLAFGNAQPEQWGESARRVDFYDVKKDVENLLPKNIIFQAASHPALHPGRTAQIFSDDRIIGFIGEMHPKWVQKYDLPYAPIIAELDLSAVMTRSKTVYREVSKFPAVRRDLAFVMPESVRADDLLRVLRSVKNEWIHDIAVFDVYRGKGLPENHKSLAVSIILQSFEKTLPNEETDGIMTQLIEAAKEIGAVLRA